LPQTASSRAFLCCEMRIFSPWLSLETPFPVRLRLFFLNDLSFSIPKKNLFFFHIFLEYDHMISSVAQTLPPGTFFFAPWTNSRIQAPFLLVLSALQDPMNGFEVPPCARYTVSGNPPTILPEVPPFMLPLRPTPPSGTFFS